MTRYSIFIKFLAILLAACALVTAAAGAFGIVLLTQLDMYNADDYAQWRQEELEDRANTLACELANDYAMRTYSDCPENVQNAWSGISQLEWNDWLGLRDGSWYYELSDVDGNSLAHGGTPGITGQQLSFTVASTYLVRCTAMEVEIQINNVMAKEVMGPTYQVTVILEDDAMLFYNGLPVECIDWIFSVRYWLIAALIVGLMVFAVCAVYLCCAAGRSGKDSPIAPGGLNRLPLDAYFLAAGALCCGLVAMALQVLDSWVLNESLNAGAIALALVGLLAAAVTGIGFCFAVAAQTKLRRWWWLKNTLIGRAVGLLWRCLRWLGRAGEKLVSLLPLTWRYLLIGLVMVGAPCFFFILTAFGNSFWLLPLLLSCAADVCIACYGAYAYGTLLRGAGQMAEGDLEAKLDTQHLLGSYRQCAQHLNALADVATVAAEKQLRSERMKTELITNVSHDIKTPLTSIISYVDLLEKPHTDEEGAAYIEVLGRQSQRLKKLVDDLIEMSKATTGNMTVQPESLDAAEAVSQALGEFADKLQSQSLTPVVRQPEGPVRVLADGRLTWRVLSNLLSNTVKYALPGTRVYLDLRQEGSRVRLSIKNISREELNVSADELTERFVRGDVSRNTEGSGLGLNIAKSLMELQKGSLELTVDGDLFKVTLEFPAVRS